jgi:putative transposase
MAKETSDWGYDQIAGAMVNLGYRRSDQTVGNIPQRHGIPPAPRGSVRQRGQTLSAHTMSVFAGTDVFTVKVLTLRGLVTYYVLFFSHLESRKVEVSGITQHPNERWMNQIARNMATDKWGFLDNCNYLIHDRDTK